MSADQFTILLKGQPIKYTVARKKNARNLRLAMQKDGLVRVTLPKLAPLFIAPKFLTEKADWILANLQKYQKAPHILITESVQSLRSKTQVLVRERIEHFNTHYQCVHGPIKIGHYKSRWGACSKNKQLAFDYRLAALPRHLTDYIVVHELCHLKEFNHSPEFWRHVAQQIPDHLKRRRELRALVIEHA